MFSVILHYALGVSIAVIYRVNRDAEAVLSALVSEGVPSMVASEQNALANLSIRKLLSILSAIVLYGKDDALIPVLQIFSVPLSHETFLLTRRDNLRLTMRRKGS